jgi:hypothetical protein
MLLFVEEDVLKARRAIGQELRPKLKDLESIRWVPGQGYSYLLSALVMRFCKLYLKPKNWLLQALLWVIAEIIFPIRFGNILLFILLIIGIINVILDMVTSGLQKSWGFGQLLPAFMLLLPFFSLAQNCASKSFALSRTVQQLLTHILEKKQLCWKEHKPVRRLEAPAKSDNVIEVHEIEKSMA